jgi:hypothetical protein
MKPSQVAQVCAISMITRVPLFIHGEPGGAKSSVARQTTKALGRTFLDMRGAGLDIGDLAIPFPNVATNRVAWMISGDLPSEPDTVWLWDDASQMTPAVWNMLSEPLLDRTFKGAENYILPDDCTIIATGNRKSDRSATHTTPQHINNRFMHVDMDTDTDEWIEYVRDPNVPPNLSAVLSIPYTPPTTIHPHLTAFYRFRPTLLHAFDPNMNAYPTPRSASMLNQVLPFVLAPQLADISYSLIQGCQGEGVAVELSGFIQLIQQMPDPDLPLNSPLDAPIPTAPGIRYALMGALAERVTPRTANNLFKYLFRYTQAQDFAVLCVKDAMRKNPSILQCPEGIKWASANMKFLTA